MINIKEIDSQMIANNLMPFEPTHPGEVLKNEIEYRGISQNLLAKQIGISYKILNDILNERRPITTTTAMLFEAALGIDSDLLMRLQIKYNMQIIKQDKSFIKRLAEIRKITAML
ncbi:MAG: HigA family addiction module antidote protein [Prevotellaceae bacterium]|jgi:addiction module HigA family antidote|nr:HigA family addiction module antidote protein [Prevotellaceae bacterium]